MNYYKCIIAYDGTDFYGWQLQPDRPTITQALQAAFKHVFEVEATIVGASRTDAGVHAHGQVAVCRTELELDATKLMWAWNNRLRDDILIWSCMRVDSNFHPQHNVRQKTYRYYFSLDRPLPDRARYCWYVRKKVDIQKLYECLTVFVGTHDFRSFCTGDDMKDDTIRTIDSISLTELKHKNRYCIEVKGHSFLRYMIRRIVGGSLFVASKSFLPVDYLSMVLKERNPEQQLLTAPAQGLILQSIEYIQGD